MVKQQLMTPLMVAVSKLVNLDEGWAGIDSRSPSLRAIQEAMVFARQLPGNIPQPFVSPGTDGEVNFWWKYGKVQIDLGFYGEGTYSYFARLKDGSEFEADNIHYKTPLDANILRGM